MEILMPSLKRSCEAYLEKPKIAHDEVAVLLTFVEYDLYTPRLYFLLLVVH